ncbi:hypothetical protein N7533_008368 [Penicillium manginii]|uniref:uncharacterized protein n=1 Tax=Penicillium manginii TaxID=203109 RepID=UPI002546E6C9|nr:uncharacterized protein N7533_008368 [Penicillium manginii]KAJ5751340.1 hypothetical protein N7533_008368 [Penicillium manginii]
MSQSQQNQSNQPHHESMMERIFEHHGHPQHDDGKKQEVPSEPKPSTPHKESEKEKYLNWYHKEEEEEAEGDTYGGLM